MKKFYSLITMLILVLLLGACTGGNSGLSASEAKEYYESTITEYASANSVKIVLTMESVDETLTTELAYNKNDSQYVDYLLKQTDAEGTITTIIKDNKTYIDVQGNKSVVDTNETEMAELMEKYAFDGLTSYVRLILSPSFFTASTVESSDDSKATLVCDTSSLELDESLSDKELLKQEEIIFNLQLKNSVKLEIEYANSKATKVVVLIEDLEGNVEKITLEFVSTSAQTIVVENPNEYEAK